MIIVKANWLLHPIFCGSSGLPHMNVRGLVTFIREKIIFSRSNVAENFSHLCRLDNFHFLPQPCGEFLARDTVANGIVLMIILEKILFRESVLRGFFFGEFF